MLSALMQHFATLDDPRLARTRLHSLTDILGVALCAVICGADTWIEIEAYGLAKQEWLGQWLTLTNGIPSHDTFARVFARLDARALGGCLQALTQTLATCLEKHLALDGKYLRHSFDTQAKQGPRVLLNAWASEQRLVLASLPVDTKSNEIKAVPELLALLDLTGCIVTLDAMGCQKAIAQQIVEQGGDYVLALKGNQESIHTDVAVFFAHASERKWEDVVHDVHTQQEYGHARHGKSTAMPATARVRPCPPRQEYGHARHGKSTAMPATKYAAAQASTCRTWRGAGTT